MNTIKATYWIGLAVLALALTSGYRNGQFPAVHRVADRAASTLCRVTARAEQTFAMARLMIGREALPTNVLLASNASDLAQTQADIREQARAQAEMLRDEMREQARGRAEMMREQMRAQAEIIRAQVYEQRSQIQRIQSRAQQDFRFNTATERHVVLNSPEGCPKIRLRVNAAPEALPDPADEDDNLF